MNPNRILVLCTVIVTAALSTGCHSSSNSVVRTVIITKVPSEECITNAVRQVRGIDHVLPVTIASGPTWSVYHRYNRDLPSQNYRYLGPNNTRGIVSVKPQFDNAVGLEFSSTWTERKPTTAEVDNARRIMDDIYNNLMKECGNLPPPESVAENFVNLKEYQKTHGDNTGSPKPSP